MIGTLNEGALHAQLKEWYRRPRDRVEQPVGAYVVDLVRGDLLIEIQTGNFAPLRRKLEELLRTHRVRLVAPVAVTRRIVRVSDDGVVLSARRSPKAGRLEDVFAQLVSIPSLLAHDGFELEVLLTHQEEVRLFRPGRAYRRRGWIVAGRSLASVEGSVTVSCLADALALLPAGPAAVVRHRGARRRRGDRSQARAADDVLPAARGRARDDGQARAGRALRTRRVIGGRHFGAITPRRTCVRCGLGPSQIDL